MHAQCWENDEISVVHTRNIMLVSTEDCVFKNLVTRENVLQDYVQYDSHFIFKMFVETTERKYTKTLPVIHVSGRFTAYFYFLILLCIFYSEHVFL